MTVLKQDYDLQPGHDGVPLLPRDSIDEDLPPHWFRYFTEDDEHEEYFYNELTGETVWEHPSSPPDAAEGAAAAEEEEHVHSHVEPHEEIDEGTLKPHASEDPVPRYEAPVEAQPEEESPFVPQQITITHNDDIEEKERATDEWEKSELEFTDPLQCQEAEEAEHPLQPPAPQVEDIEEEAEEPEVDYVDPIVEEEEYEVQSRPVAPSIPPPPPPPPPPLSSGPPKDIPRTDHVANNDHHDEKLFYNTADAHKTHTQSSIWDDEVNRVSVSTRVEPPATPVVVVFAAPESQSMNKSEPPQHYIEASTPFNPDYHSTREQRSVSPSNSSNPFADDEPVTSSNPFAAPSVAARPSLVPPSTIHTAPATVQHRAAPHNSSSTVTSAPRQTQPAAAAPSPRTAGMIQMHNKQLQQLQPPPPHGNPLLDSSYSRYHPAPISNTAGRQRPQQQPPQPPCRPRRRPDLFGPVNDTHQPLPASNLHPTAAILEYNPEHVVTSTPVVATLISEERGQPVRLPKSNTRIPIDLPTVSQSSPSSTNSSNTAPVSPTGSVTTPPSNAGVAPAVLTKQPSSMMEALRRDKLLRQQQHPDTAASSTAPAPAPAPAPVMSRSRSPLIDAPPAISGMDPQQLQRQGSSMLRHNFDGVPPNVTLSPNTKLLMYFGVRYAAAEEALAIGHQDAWKALHDIHEAVVTSLHNNPYLGLPHIYCPRISTRIKSWMPNFQDDDKKDYHTCYVVTVTYHRIAHPQDALISYRITLRYNQFKDLHIVLQRHLKHTEILESFPMSSMSQSLFGIDDKQRFERMNKFDAWLREVIANPIAMTTKEIVQAVYRLLDVEQQTQQS